MGIHEAQERMAKRLGQRARDLKAYPLPDLLQVIISSLADDNHVCSPRSPDLVFGFWPVQRCRHIPNELRQILVSQHLPDRMGFARMEPVVILVSAIRGCHSV